MKRQRRWRRVLVFGLRFFLAAPACLAVWWFVLPFYAHALGVLCRPVINLGTGPRVTSVDVARSGVLDTKTALCFETDSGTRRLAIGQLVTNVAPFAALMLATGGLGVRRRLGLTLLGLAVLGGAHAAFVLLAFTLANTGRSGTDLPVAFGQLVITLPFLLWLVLCWWAGALPPVAVPPQEDK